MSGAGTSEGYKEAGKFRYSCPSHPHLAVVAHDAWIWWCPLCGHKVNGPQVRTEQ